MKALKLTGIIVCSLLTTSTFAQNWRTGGNAPCPGPQCVDGTNNILGPQDNVPLRVITNGIQDLNPYAVFSCHYSLPKSSTLAH